ncbi:MAG: SDR family oxidoreductase [Aphanocapsa sp. GSE-SYN-MK-11-07L]|jgi:3-oxoacyl-[acyl-carrier protein] reductase|nr:SDR family oxidoreductase [Aphanocapsa sp. GSE-SYN-MK-11-07L]
MVVRLQRLPASCKRDRYTASEFLFVKKYMPQRPIALVTGASRSIGIGSSITKELAQSGWDVALTYWQPYDVSMPWGSDPREVQLLRTKVESFGVRSTAIEVDLSLADSAVRIFDTIEHDLGSVTAIVMAHCHSVDSDILSTSVESFDLHFAINARAAWLLVREFGKQFQGEFGTGRIIAITSDHTAGIFPMVLVRVPWIELCLLRHKNSERWASQQM